MMPRTPQDVENGLSEDDLQARAALAGLPMAKLNLEPMRQHGAKLQVRCSKYFGCGFEGGRRAGLESHLSKHLTCGNCGMVLPFGKNQTAPLERLLSAHEKWCACHPPKAHSTSPIFATSANIGVLIPANLRSIFANQASITAYNASAEDTAEPPKKKMRL